LRVTGSATALRRRVVASEVFAIRDGQRASFVACSARRLRRKRREIGSVGARGLQTVALTWLDSTAPKSGRERWFSMGDNSDIEWTDATWNPVRGCTKVSAGCKFCYAETFAERWRGVPGHPYEHGFDVRTVPESLSLPLRWTRPRLVFVNSMSDLFHKDIPDDYIDTVFGVMAAARIHTFQVLTKRAERLRDYMSTDRRLEWANAAAGQVPGYAIGDVRCDYIAHGPRVLPNVWLGVSVEDQKAADTRIPLLMECRAAVRFLSCEPLLGPLDLQLDAGYENGLHWVDAPQPDWVIVGGESGPGARPCSIDWIQRIVDDCKSHHVPAFVKQLGAAPFILSTALKLKSRKGKDMAEWPEGLRIREFPEASS
jgi:protein gp37